MTAWTTLVGNWVSSARTQVTIGLVVHQSVKQQNLLSTIGKFLEPYREESSPSLLEYSMMTERKKTKVWRTSGLYILTCFWVLRALKSWSKHFFKAYSFNFYPFLFFCLIFFSNWVPLHLKKSTSFKEYLKTQFFICFFLFSNE